MGKRAHYWAVAWGGTEYRDSKRDEPVIRLAGPLKSSTMAKIDAFGLALEDMTTIEMPGNPRYLSYKLKQVMFKVLREKHYQNCDRLQKLYEEKMAKLQHVNDTPDSVSTAMLKPADPIGDMSGSEYEWI